jgi:tetratricopeptide (TPR) repeat protein
MSSSTLAKTDSHYSRPESGATTALLSLVALLLGGCAGARPAATLQLRSFLGASADGSYACAELSSSPGAPSRARLVKVAPDGASAGDEPLGEPAAQAALEKARSAGDSPTRTVESALEGLSVPGFGAEGVVVLPVGQGQSRWSLEPIPGARCELRLVEADGEVRATLRLEGDAEEQLVSRMPLVGKTRIDQLLLLPGGRRALARLVSASVDGKEIHRLEGLAELEIGASLADLLDARGVALLQKGEAASARELLERAVKAAPSDAVSNYNLACALALLGEQDPAILALGHAVELEPRLSDEALRDPDLDSLRDRIEFRLMIEPRSEDL